MYTHLLQVVLPGYKANRNTLGSCSATDENGRTYGYRLEFLGF